MSAEPADEVEHVRVSPHPGRKTLKSTQGLVGIGVHSNAAHVTIDSIGVWPVGFNCNRAKAFFRDEPFGEFGSLAIEIVGTMRRLADQGKTRIADEVQQSIVIV